MKTRQELFDAVITHLASQKCQCVNTEGSCVYRGPEGRKCAIGALLSDDYYYPALDSSVGGVRVSKLPDITIVRGIGFNTEASDRSFLDRLQESHDRGGQSDVYRLQTYLYRFATIYKLDASRVVLITEWANTRAAGEMDNNA